MNNDAPSFSDLNYDVTLICNHNNDDKRIYVLNNNSKLLFLINDDNLISAFRYDNKISFYAE